MTRLADVSSIASPERDPFTHRPSRCRKRARLGSRLDELARHSIVSSYGLGLRPVEAVFRIRLPDRWRDCGVCFGGRMSGRRSRRRCPRCAAARRLGWAGATHRQAILHRARSPEGAADVVLSSLRSNADQVGCWRSGNEPGESALNTESGTSTSFALAISVRTGSVLTRFSACGRNSAWSSSSVWPLTLR